MQHLQLAARIDEDSWEVEEAVLDRSAKDKRCDVHAVWAEDDVVRRLVLVGMTLGHNAVINKVIDADDVTTILGEVAEDDSTRPVARIVGNKETNSRVLK